MQESKSFEIYRNDRICNTIIYLLKPEPQLLVELLENVKIYWILAFATDQLKGNKQKKRKEYSLNRNNFFVITTIFV